MLSRCTATPARQLLQPRGGPMDSKRQAKADLCSLLVRACCWCVDGFSGGAGGAGYIGAPRGARHESPCFWLKKLNRPVFDAPATTSRESPRFLLKNPNRPVFRQPFQTVRSFTFFTGRKVCYHRKRQRSWSILRSMYLTDRSFPNGSIFHLFQWPKSVLSQKTAKVVVDP